MLAAPDDIEVRPEAGISLNSARTHHRRPDVVVFSARDVEDSYLMRPPLLAVAVLSLSTALRDLNIKRRDVVRDWSWTTCASATWTGGVRRHTVAI